MAAIVDMEVRPMEAVTLRCVMPRGFELRVRVAKFLITAASRVLGCGVEFEVRIDQPSIHMETGKRETDRRREQEAAAGPELPGPDSRS